MSYLQHLVGCIGCRGQKFILTLDLSISLTPEFPAHFSQL